MKVIWYSWERQNENLDLKWLKNIELEHSELFMRDRIRPFNDKVTKPEGRNDEEIRILSDEFYKVLRESVWRRLRNIPNYCKSCSKTNAIKFEDELAGLAHSKCPHAKCAIMFSGGIDSAVLAALADECLPPSDPIDLLNVAFEMTSQSDVNKRFLVPDRITGIECLKELNPKRKWNFVQINVK